MENVIVYDLVVVNFIQALRFSMFKRLTAETCITFPKWINDN